MRTATFLLALLCLAAVLFADTSLRTPVPELKPISMQRGELMGDGIQMWRRVEISVVPLDLAVAHRAELQSLRDRVMDAQARTARLEITDPAVREQLLAQNHLLNSLLDYAERQNSNEGKSPEAISVQHRLNQIQGKASCEACHATVISQQTAP